MNNRLLKGVQHLTYLDHISSGQKLALLCAITPVNRSPLTRSYNLLLKRILDIVLSMLVIVCVLSWLLPLLALLIKIDSRGPVFFIQKRNKKNGKTFYCLKLRTMVVNKEADTLTATRNDHRITGLGNFLRISHLDELPQFINVFFGEMSVIGPRPHMPVENIKYNLLFNAYNDRHLVKPGITGLAQSFGCHGPVSNIHQIEKKVAYDIFYINNWSLAMDIKILFRTLTMVYKKINYL